MEQDAAAGAADGRAEVAAAAGLPGRLSAWIDAGRGSAASVKTLKQDPDFRRFELGFMLYGLGLLAATPLFVTCASQSLAVGRPFAAAAQETRQAIEASLSALSSALNDVGLSFTGGGVSSQTPQQTLTQGGNPGQDGRGGRSPDGRPSGDEADLTEAGGLRQVSAPRASRAGGLDLYA